MDLFLHKSLCDMEKAGRLSSSGKASAGDQRGGTYIARVQYGYDENNQPKYRYFRSQDEYKAYLKQQSNVKDKDGNKNKERLKEKLEAERKESKDKRDDKVGQKELKPEAKPEKPKEKRPRSLILSLDKEKAY